MDIFTLRFYLILGLMLVLTLGGSIYTLRQMNQTIHQESMEKQVEAALWQAQEAIESRKRTALSISLILSNSPSILKAYEDSNREAVFEEVHKYLESMKTFGDFGQVDIQFHTKDLEAWVRSWDKRSFGMPLSGFRKGLVHVKKSQTPYVSIELGKRLNIKAISPILLKDDFIGSVEVIVGFEAISQNLIEKNIEFMVLLDKEHLDIAEWERSKSHINKYTLISETCPCESSLEDFAKFSRFKEGFLEDKSRIYGFLPLFNIDATPLGYLGVALQKNKIFHGNQILKIDQESILPMLSITSSKTSKTKIDIR